MQELKSKITEFKKKSQWTLKVNWISQKKGDLDDKTMEIIIYEEARKKKRDWKKWRKPKPKPVQHQQEDQHMHCEIPEEKRGINSKKLTLKQNIINLSKVKDIENLGNATLYM